MRRPPVSLIRRFDTHRLVPSRYLSGGDSVLVAIADNDAHLAAIFELDLATNDRLLAEHQLLPGIGLEELVSNVPFAAVINAAFCHAHPLGSRFNGPERGAWCAGFELETSQAEVAFHKSVQLAEIDRFEESVTYDDYLADFSASFHDLRLARGFRACLDPQSYVGLRRSPRSGWKWERSASCTPACGALQERAQHPSAPPSSATYAKARRTDSHGMAHPTRPSPTKKGPHRLGRGGME